MSNWGRIKYCNNPNAKSSSLSQTPHFASLPTNNKFKSLNGLLTVRSGCRCGCSVRSNESVLCVVKTDS